MRRSPAVLAALLTIAGCAGHDEHDTPEPTSTFEQITAPPSSASSTTSPEGAPVPSPTATSGTGAPATVPEPPVTCPQDADEIAAGEVPATPPCEP